MKGTATVTDNDVSDQGLPDDDIFAWLQRREMIIEWDRLIKSEGNETIDALYQVVLDAWIEGVGTAPKSRGRMLPKSKCCLVGPSSWFRSCWVRYSLRSSR